MIQLLALGSWKPFRLSCSSEFCLSSLLDLPPLHLEVRVSNGRLLGVCPFSVYVPSLFLGKMIAGSLSNPKPMARTKWIVPGLRILFSLFLVSCYLLSLNHLLYFSARPCVRMTKHPGTDMTAVNWGSNLSAILTVALDPSR